MEGGGADADHASPVSPSPPGQQSPSQGDVTTVLDRTIQTARLILSELHRQGLRDAGQDLRLHGGAYRNDRFVAIPASSEAIASLREMTVVEQTREDECAVCLKSYEEGDKIKMMPCSHGFHGDCLLKWLGISRLCPLCRFVLQAEVGTD
ncbi:unnamed protein product [Urochloa humidicola]